jgi:hypothetical protein
LAVSLGLADGMVCVHGCILSISVGVFKVEGQQHIKLFTFLLYYTTGTSFGDLPFRAPRAAWCFVSMLSMHLWALGVVWV